MYFTYVTSLLCVGVFGTNKNTFGIIICQKRPPPRLYHQMVAGAGMPFFYYLRMHAIETMDVGTKLDVKFKGGRSHNLKKFVERKEEEIADRMLSMIWRMMLSGGR